jgi:hypothetical protein
MFSRRLREDKRRKRPEKWRMNNCVQHHDNARLHMAYSVQELLPKNMMKVVPHPQHSPDLAPCDFLLFPKMKTKLKGQRFDTVEDIQAETQTVLNTLIKKKTSRMHFKSSINAGISVCTPKGTILKVMVQNKIQVICNSFY